jgi:hypothetical protein
MDPFTYVRRDVIPVMKTIAASQLEMKRKNCKICHVYRKKLRKVLPKSSSRALHGSEGDNILIANLKEIKKTIT